MSQYEWNISCGNLNALLSIYQIIVYILYVYTYWLENGSVAQSRRLGTTDLFEGQTKLLLPSNPVNKCFVILLHFFKFSTRISQEYWERVNITWVRHWTNENKASGQQFDSGKEIHVNRTVLQQIGNFFGNSQNILYLLYCF